MGRNTKIDWCDSSWNPVTGCYHDCPYCYARGIANRFGGATLYDISNDGKLIEKALPKNGKRIHVLGKPVKKGTMHPNGEQTVTTAPYPYRFEPTLHRYKLDEPQKWKQPRNIFVCSMADLFGDWVPLKWIHEVFEACRKAPQHRYLFLTKAPERYISLARLWKLPTEDNFWFGSSTPTLETPYFYADKFNTFVSIEPLLEPFHYIGAAKPEELPKWIIIGAETGNRKGKIIPKKEWVDEITRYAQGNGIPVFMKESLRAIMGEDFRQEFPWHTGGGCNGDYCEL